ALAVARWPGPVVVAGNVDAQPAIVGLLDAAGTPCVSAGNVVPRIGVLAPTSARAAIRQMFLRHVIGGKHLSTGPEFAAMVLGATPDVVLTAVELLSYGVPDEGLPGTGDVVVVDVGGATSDVYSAVEPREDDLDHDVDGGLSRDVVGAGPVNRTVEGDLGMRWSAVPTVEEAHAAALVGDDELPALRSAAQRRAADPAYVPTTPEEAELDLQLAAYAVGLALRRHAGRAQVRFAADPDRRGGMRLVERSGIDLREVALLVGSGGALRHAERAADRLLDHVTTDGGWQVPEHPRVVVDRDYVLAPAGLLATDHPGVASRLLQFLR
ncbi:MAG: hypothetical protein QOK15_2837, partial [Nocardioidaceae bacterium]|nr:hypothetical protein [Nocardioidaceae bacterium]